MSRRGKRAPAPPQPRRWWSYPAIFASAFLLMAGACYLGMRLFYFLIWLLGDLEFSPGMRSWLTWGVTLAGGLAMGIWAVAEDDEISGRKQGRRRRKRDQA